MIDMRAVVSSESRMPEPQAGAKCEALPVRAVNARRASAARAPYLATVVRFITTAALVTPI